MPTLSEVNCAADRRRGCLETLVHIATCRAVTVKLEKHDRSVAWLSFDSESDLIELLNVLKARTQRQLAEADRVLNDANITDDTVAE